MAKITDFGTAKSINTQTKIHQEVIPYMAPELLKHGNSQPPPFSKGVDIYSLGVLLWELSSGYPPFKNHIDMELISNIINGRREQKIRETPSFYYDLYTACWDGNPKRRPIIEHVHNKLKNILSKSNEIITIDKVT